MSILNTVLLATALCSSCAWAQAPGFRGELGGMLTHTAALVQGASEQSSVLPYVYGNWGRFYGRVDTFGVQVRPLGQGHLELATRISTEGFEARKTSFPALSDRRSPMPVGLGTFQRTELGGVFAYFMHDPRSGGQFAEINWAGLARLGPVTFYPQLGLQYRSSAYVSYLYGVSATESQATGERVWQPRASWAPQLTLHASWPLTGAWSLQGQVRQRWFDDAVADSPLVQRSHQTSGLLALTYTLN